MNDNDDKILMKKYSITCVKTNSYHYKSYTYGKLEDAVNYAKLDYERCKVKINLTWKQRITQP